MQYFTRAGPSFNSFGFGSILGLGTSDTPIRQIIAYREPHSLLNHATHEISHLPSTNLTSEINFGDRHFLPDAAAYNRGDDTQTPWSPAH